MSPPLIKVTYSIVTPESAEDGDFAESGWEDEDGFDCTPDEFDVLEGLTAVDVASRLLLREGVMEPSSSFYQHGVWFSSYPETDYRTGESKTRSFYLYGFTEAEGRAVFQAVRKGV